MVYAMRSKIIVLLLLCFCVNLTVANRWGRHIYRRDGPTTPSSTIAESTTTTASNVAPTGSAGSDNGSKSSISTSTTSTASTTTSASSTAISSTIPSSTTASLSPVASNLNGVTPTSFLNYSGYNSTLTPDDLPIVPRITPGLGVAGVIMAITGIVYTLVGIKNKQLHVFLSAAYLASAAVTVLVLYVMNPPITDAVQGAYVVAITITGLILGGAAIIFTEMTEGLGCILGGFCFSMWLLVLQPGGLLTTTSSKSIFIAAFTVAGFSTSFSHYTRPYGLIVSISFSGATAVVLGIDCFSRAGLKEFWAYLWDLNNNLFPLGATSYPLTRGIKVEIAAIVVIFLAGVISQMKLWKMIKERREHRAAERLKDERSLEQEEEQVGRTIEHANAEERDKWEAVYGDKDGVKANVRDSGVGDMDSQKKGALSSVSTVRRSGSDDEIEMSEMRSPTLTSGAGLVMLNNGQEGAITVRVARDAEPAPELDEDGNVIPTAPKRNSLVSPRNSTHLHPEEEAVWIVGTDGEARLERRSSKRDSRRKSAPTASPDVIPLPFKVPEDEVGDDRSSVATFADEEQEQNDQNIRRSGSKRLSIASAAMMKRLSRLSHRSSKNFSIGEGVSSEDLVIPREIEEDRRSSLAATMDGLSDDEDFRSLRSSIHQAPDTTEAGRAPEESEINVVSSNPRRSGSKSSAHLMSPKENARPLSEMTVATNILDPDKGNEKQTDGKMASEEVKNEAESATETTLEVPKTRKSGSVASASNARTSSLTKDRLPPQLSRVVMSYRTNEWAKHLSNADSPHLEELKLAEYPTETSPTKIEETPAPLNVEELQQTPENAMQPTAPRSMSQASHNVTPPLTRSSSAQSKVHSSQQIVDVVEPGLVRTSSQTSFSLPVSQINAMPRGFRSSSSPYIPQSIVESPIEEDFPPQVPTPTTTRPLYPQAQTPFSSNATLMGKRENMVRNKAAPFYSGQQSLTSTPEIAYQQYSQYNNSSTPISRAGSDAGSLYNYPNANAILYDGPEDDEMSLSTRRKLIRQSSLLHSQSSTPIPMSASTSQQNLQNLSTPFDSHQPRRQSTTPSPVVREQQMASWRASVQHGLNTAVQPNVAMNIERQRSALWQERQQEEQRRVVEERRRGERDSMFDERMRRGDMLDAHREALRKMQATANEKVRNAS